MRSLENIQILRQEKIPVESLLTSPAGLVSLNDPVGLKNEIISKSIYRPQLALAGFIDLFSNQSVQIFGNTEIFYLKSLTPEEKIVAFCNLFNFKIPCIILTNGHKLEPELLELASKNNISVLTTDYDTTKTTYIMTEFLDDQFAPQAVVHGSFVDVYGVGILFMGRSGIGKSEVALDLVERGHRLVADDVVMLTKKKESILMGTGTNLVQHFMEIRGLRIIDVRQMFGVRSIRFQKRLEIIVELQEFNPEIDYTRIGQEDEPTDIMDVQISTVKLPIFPGKNITVIAEVIAVHYLLRTYGYNSALKFSERLQNEINRKSNSESPFSYKRAVPYIQPDDE